MVEFLDARYGVILLPSSSTISVVNDNTGDCNRSIVDGEDNDDIVFTMDDDGNGDANAALPLLRIEEQRATQKSLFESFESIHT
jgi:hypothetical protein